MDICLPEDMTLRVAHDIVSCMSASHGGRCMGLMPLGPPDLDGRIAHPARCLQGEALQVKLELLPEVARAYVHVDWETLHTPEH